MERMTPYPVRPTPNRTERHNYLLFCEQTIIVVKLKEEPRKWYRAVKYENKSITVQRSDLVTDLIPFKDIIDVAEGCECCEPTDGHTRTSDANKEPNILSKARGKISMGHRFCFKCGRELE